VAGGDSSLATKWVTDVALDDVLEVAFHLMRTNKRVLWVPLVALGDECEAS